MRFFFFVVIICRECSSGYAKNEQTGECDDIDECEGTDVSCNMETQVCYNLPGSYKCLDILPAPSPTSCPNGFNFDTKIKQCIGIFLELHFKYSGSLMFVCDFPSFLLYFIIDINECETKEAICGNNKECLNVPGGYECIDTKKQSNKFVSFTHKKNRNTIRINIIYYIL